jgi:hypothetical protein
MFTVVGVAIRGLDDDYAGKRRNDSNCVMPACLEQFMLRLIGVLQSVSMSTFRIALQLRALSCVARPKMESRTAKLTSCWGRLSG